MGTTILSGVILGFCALLMIAIGIGQIKSKTPVGFYTGEQPPDEKDLSDKNAWNKKHGTMWITYGLCIALTWVCGSIIGESWLLPILFFAGLLLPIPFMIFYHHRLIKKYRIRKK